MLKCHLHNNTTEHPNTNSSMPVQFGFGALPGSTRAGAIEGADRAGWDLVSERCRAVADRIASGIGAFEGVCCWDLVSERCRAVAVPVLPAWGRSRARTAVSVRFGFEALPGGGRARVVLTECCRRPCFLKIRRWLCRRDCAAGMGAFEGTDGAVPVAFGFGAGQWRCQWHCAAEWVRSRARTGCADGIWAAAVTVGLCFWAVAVPAGLCFRHGGVRGCGRPCWCDSVSERCPAMGRAGVVLPECYQRRRAVAGGIALPAWERLRVWTGPCQWHLVLEPGSGGASGIVLPNGCARGCGRGCSGGICCRAAGLCLCHGCVRGCGRSRAGCQVAAVRVSLCAGGIWFPSVAWRWPCR